MLSFIFHGQRYKSSPHDKTHFSWKILSRGWVINKAIYVAGKRSIIAWDLDKAKNSVGW